MRFLLFSMEYEMFVFHNKALIIAHNGWINCYNKFNKSIK